MPFVYSTLANDNKYTGYTKGGADLPRTTYEILIKGGTGVAGKWTRLETPQGVVTEVTEEEAAALADNVVFKRHQQNGFIFVSDKKADPENVAADMTGRDNSAPLVEADFENAKTPAGDTIKAPTHSGKGKR